MLTNGTVPRARPTGSLVAGAVLAAMLSAPLEAQDLDQVCSGKLVDFPLPPFQAFDTDGNGTIDKREARDCRSLREVFEELDLDDDHDLDQPEYSAFSTIWTERAETFGVDE